MKLEDVRMMKLALAAAAIQEPGVSLTGSASTEIRGIAYDSRAVHTGDLFVALPGLLQNGALFIDEALRRGAAAVLHQAEILLPRGVAGICVQQARPAMADVSAAFYGHPSRILKVAGITGTNGKSTTAFMLRDLLRAAQIPTALIGTIQYEVDRRVIPAARTTPEAPDLQRIFATALQTGCAAAVMEVSSQGIAMERHRGIHFSGALFTNLTRDHLDFHGSMEDYFASKRRLFAELDPETPVVISLEDAYGRRLAAEFAREKQYTFGFSDAAQVRAQDVQMDIHGSSFHLATPWGTGDVCLAFPGRHNILNALGAVAMGGAWGLPFSVMLDTLSAFQPVPGRLERIPDAGGRHIFVDYAHTDDALQNVLSTLRAVSTGRILCVFGCGGGRDKAKRALMGEVVSKLADWAMLTSDNPRNEDPEAILADILKGFDAACPHCVEADRGKAIHAALQEARRGDVVLVAGKGHETYQETAGTRVPFDDREVIRRLLD